MIDIWFSLPPANSSIGTVSGVNLEQAQSCHDLPCSLSGFPSPLLHSCEETRHTHFFLGYILRIKDEYLSYRHYDNKIKSTLLYQVCEHSLLCVLPVKSTYLSRAFFLSHTSVVKGGHNSESFKTHLGEETGKKKDDFAQT